MDLMEIHGGPVDLDFFEIHGFPLKFATKNTLVLDLSIDRPINIHNTKLICKTT